MKNESIIVCGKKFNINTRVVLWNETNGFNAYNTSKYIINIHDRKTGKNKKKIISGKRYGDRKWGGVTFEKLQGIITQFFLHHSGLYRSRDTFHVLHNERGLSVHFILDDDGTIYQTLDLKEKALHGGQSNQMSVGIEIDSKALVERFPYAYDSSHQYKYKVSSRKKRMDKIHGKWIEGYEYNEKQYIALSKLAIGLKNIFPLLKTPNSQYSIDFPRTNNGLIIKSNIINFKQHRGFICHYNNSHAKIDPISFDHNRLVLSVDKNNPYQASSFEENISWKKIQEYLKYLGYNPGLLDNQYGPKTKKALQEFQKDNGLQPDGIFGSKTEYVINLKIWGKNVKNK